MPTCTTAFFKLLIKSFLTNLVIGILITNDSLIKNTPALIYADKPNMILLISFNKLHCDDLLTVNASSISLSNGANFKTTIAIHTISLDGTLHTVPTAPPSNGLLLPF